MLPLGFEELYDLLSQLLRVDGYVRGKACARGKGKKKTTSVEKTHSVRHRCKLRSYEGCFHGLQHPIWRQYIYTRILPTRMRLIFIYILEFRLLSRIKSPLNGLVTDKSLTAHFWISGMISKCYIKQSHVEENGIFTPRQKPFSELVHKPRYKSCAVSRVSVLNPPNSLKKKKKIQYCLVKHFAWHCATHWSLRISPSWLG